MALAAADVDSKPALSAPTPSRSPALLQPEVAHGVWSTLIPLVTVAPPGCMFPKHSFLRCSPVLTAPAQTGARAPESGPAPGGSGLARVALLVSAEQGCPGPRLESEPPAVSGVRLWLPSARSIKGDISCSRRLLSVRGAACRGPVSRFLEGTVWSGPLRALPWSRAGPSVVRSFTALSSEFFLQLPELGLTSLETRPPCLGPFPPLSVSWLQVFSVQARGAALWGRRSSRLGQGPADRGAAGFGAPRRDSCAGAGGTHGVLPSTRAAAEKRLSREAGRCGDIIPRVPKPSCSRGLSAWLTEFRRTEPPGGFSCGGCNTPHWGTAGRHRRMAGRAAA